MKKKTQKETRLKRIDQVFKKIGKTLKEDPVWQEWVDSGGPEFFTKASQDLDEIKPSLEEMLLDVVEAGWILENPDGDFSLLVKQKKDVITALWKVTQIIKERFKDEQAESKEWRKQLDG